MRPRAGLDSGQSKFDGPDAARHTAAAGAKANPSLTIPAAVTHDAEFAIADRVAPAQIATCRTRHRVTWEGSRCIGVIFGSGRRARLRPAPERWARLAELFPRGRFTHAFRNNQWR